MTAYFYAIKNCHYYFKYDLNSHYREFIEFSNDDKLIIFCWVDTLHIDKF